MSNDIATPVQALAEADINEAITLAFEEVERPGYHAGIDERMQLAELGWMKFPRLMHLGWAAQWLQYEAELRANLSRPALVVPIFEEEVSLLLWAALANEQHALG